MTDASSTQPARPYTGVFDRHPGSPHLHERVIFCADEASGLRAIIELYSTALGPGLGGTRFYPYASEAEAIASFGPGPGAGL